MYIVDCNVLSVWFGNVNTLCYYTMLIHYANTLC